MSFARFDRAPPAAPTLGFAALPPLPAVVVGFAAGANAFQAAITKILAYEAAGLPGLDALPSGTTAAAVQRVTYWVQYMAAGKGTLGAK